MAHRNWLAVINAAAFAAFVVLSQPAIAGDKEDCLGDYSKWPIPDFAIAACNRAIESGKYSKRDLAAFYFTRGLEYDLSDEFDHAIADYDQATKLDSKSFAVYNRANINVQKGNYARAIADYTKAIQVKPKSFPVNALLELRGVAYNGNGQYDRAIADFDQAIKLDPNNAVAFQDRGTPYANKGLYDRAISDFDQAIRLSPDNSVAFNKRGLAYANKGEINRAIADYERAIERTSINADAYNNRGQAKLKKGDTAGGNADIARAKELPATAPPGAATNH